jgi:ribosomal protein S18 acetylase RimI-like enzyme
VPTFASRVLDPHDIDAARRLAARAGVRGVYLGNVLAGGADAEEGDVLAFYGAGGLLGLALFGRRGNLVVIEDTPLDGAAVAHALRDSAFSWRIALASKSVASALIRLESLPPLVVREQLYYGVRPEDVPVELVRDDVRRAERRDQPLLFAAALDLNEADLHVDPRRVHKAWLRASIRRRVRAEQTFVVGGPGKVLCKLDIGSTGEFGTMVEGVYTFPEVRGRGLASGLVATVARAAIGTTSCVCLHVAADNQSARHAYERAGMRVMQSCELVLRA